MQRVFNGAYTREQPIGEQRQIYEDWSKYCFSLIDYNLDNLTYKPRTTPEKLKSRISDRSRKPPQPGKIPLGRPRKPSPEGPVVKRPRGRPRKIKPTEMPVTEAKGELKSQSETTKLSQEE